jgi:hypothetical protein
MAFIQERAEEWDAWEKRRVVEKEREKAAEEEREKAAEEERQREEAEAEAQVEGVPEGDGGSLEAHFQVMPISGKLVEKAPNQIINKLA